MQEALDLTQVKCVLEVNMRTLMGVDNADAWKTEFPKFKADGTPDGTLSSPGLQGLRDALAQTLLDLLTNVKGTGSPTTESDGTGGSAAKEGDNTLISLVHDSGVVSLNDNFTVAAGE